MTTTVMRAMMSTTTDAATTAAAPKPKKPKAKTPSNDKLKKDLAVNVSATYNLSLSQSEKIVNTILDDIVEVREFGWTLSPTYLPYSCCDAHAMSFLNTIVSFLPSYVCSFLSSRNLLTPCMD
jgi:hypothetical protein